MIRKIIKINKEKCNGCGLCAKACHEGAIAMIDGKAELTRDDYCDGLGDCLPVCPTDAISFETREAAPYDEAAVLAKNSANSKKSSPHTATTEDEHNSCGNLNSQLSQWPIQIKLVPLNAPYFENANLLVAADCTAFAYGNFHEEFIKNHVTLIGCPKLDSVDYSEKLAEIIKRNEIKSIKVVRMEVPCCGGIENAVKEALQSSGKMIPWQIVTISTEGQIL